MPDSLREALWKRSFSLPFMQYEKGYPICALPKSELLALLAAYPEPSDELAEAERRAERYRLAWQSAARRARGARQRGLVDAENAIREEARVSGRQLNRLILGIAARLVADLQEKP